MINLLADGMVPFTTALLIMLLIGVLEAATLFAGFSASSFLDALLPDVDLPDSEVDINSGGDGIHGPLAHIFSWLSIGRVPALVLLVIFLCSFGLGGYAIQATIQSVLGAMLPPSIASIPAGFVGLVGMSRIGALVAHILPKDQSQAANRADMLGSIAEITGGTASPGNPAQAKVKDLRGRTHFVNVEPKDEGLSLLQGDKCVLVGLKPNSSVYFGAEDVSPALEEAD